MLPPSPIDPVPDQNNVRDETFFLSALQHIRKQPLGRALHWYGWPSCPLTETDYFIFSLSNQLFVVLLVDVDGVMSMNGNHEGLLALAEKANGIACLMPMQKKASTVKVLLNDKQLASEDIAQSRLLVPADGTYELKVIGADGLSDRAAFTVISQTLY